MHQALLSKRQRWCWKDSAHREGQRIHKVSAPPSLWTLNMVGGRESLIQHSWSLISDYRLLKAQKEVRYQMPPLVHTRRTIPKEILTNQGTPFMSKLMANLRQLVQVQHHHTSVYHPQTDSLTEHQSGNSVIPYKCYERWLVREAETGICCSPMYQKPTGIYRFYSIQALNREAAQRTVGCSQRGLGVTTFPLESFCSGYTELQQPSDG